MQFFLMRHGEAVPASSWKSSDSSRPLTPVGSAKLESVVTEMKRAHFSPAVVLTSPYDRAKQTADILCKNLGLPEPIVTSELSSGVRIEAIRDVIKAHAPKGTILVVGHMPEIAVFGNRVCGELFLLDRGIEPGEVIAIEAETLDKWGKGRMLWDRKNADWRKA